jgi:PAS domain S-box-containing protein
VQNAALLAAANAIVITDREGHILWANPAFTRLTGYALDEVLGQTPRVLKSGVHDAAFYAHLWQTIQTGAVWHGQMVNQRKDGRTYTEEMTITPVHDAAGTIVRFIAIKQDVSARVAAEEAEHAARAAAEAALAQRDEFLSVAAHELKTPMTSLYGAVQLLQRCLPLDGDLSAADRKRVARSLAIVHRQSVKATQMVETLLDLSRLQRGKLRLEWAPTDLSAMVQHVVAQAEAKLEGQATLQPASPAVADQVPCTLRPVLPPEPVVAEVDALRLEQVLTNLIDNAIRYSPGGGEIEVSVQRTKRSGLGSGAAPGRAGDEGDTVVTLAVRDHGMGIPEAKRAGIFERFYQAHGEGHRSGLGLGLFISKEIVELHGGHIGVEFPEDGGTRFVVEIPYHCAASAASAKR